MALGTAAKSIVKGLFGDFLQPEELSFRGMMEVRDELRQAQRGRPEIMTGSLGTSRILEMPEFQGMKQEHRQANLDLAYQLMEEGKDNKEIATRTGFGFFNGKPMMEIDDDAAEMAQPFTELDLSKTYKAPEILKHEDFYKVYPEMKDLKIEFYDGEPPVSKTGVITEDNGYFSFEDKTIGINKNAWFMTSPRGGALSSEQPSDEAFALLMQTMLHEAQHAVQVAEKLPTGASPEDYMKGGRLGFDLSKEEATKYYRRLIGEMWARNVAERFRSEQKTVFKKTPFHTIEEGEVPVRKAILESGASTNPFIPNEIASYNNYLKPQNPFPDTTEEPY